MGLLDRLRKIPKIADDGIDANHEHLENFPEMLMAKLLFVEKPYLDSEKILKEAKIYFNDILIISEEGALVFAFPDTQFELVDAKVHAQCLVTTLDEKHPDIKIPDVAFQQNWHWQEANETARTCKYVLLVTDLLTRTLQYKQRLNLFMNFLAAVTKATNPNVIYSVHGQKLIKPSDFITMLDSQERQPLYAICNVRLYNISDTVDKESLMDTVGLQSIGLPDFQIRFSNLEVNSVANLLWGYAYYIYDKGDIIENGNTLEGIISGSKWKCERQVSPLQPERIIINVKPN